MARMMASGVTLQHGGYYYFVGLKGTGMSALAELLVRDGARVVGSDTADSFFTQTALSRLGITCFEGFTADNLPSDVDAVVFSAAYSPERHPELVRARELGLPVWSYPEVLGAYSRLYRSFGVAGVHGKTTSTAMVGLILRALGLPSRVLTGSVVPDFGDSAVLHSGGEVFVAETCEYRRHFLHFHPQGILLTAIEEDHHDYYPDLRSIVQAFDDYVQLLPQGGLLVHSADCPNVLGLVQRLRRSRADLQLVSFGRGARGEFGLTSMAEEQGRVLFSLGGLEGSWELSIPGQHNAVNASGALALAWSIFRALRGRDPDGTEREAVRGALRDFRSTYRRSQVVGQRDGILVMDDYGHHPTAIRLTLGALRRFYRPVRLVVSFMSHTYSRTAALLHDFAQSFGEADVLILHEIYASARETDCRGIDALTLVEAARQQHPRVVYFPRPLDALDFLRDELKPGDLFVTMGAGDNWKLGKAFLEAKG